MIYKTFHIKTLFYLLPAVFIFLTFNVIPGLTSLVLSSCQEEQGRILNYKKGVYLGKKDASLTKEQVNKLKMHTSRQRSN